eukprot:SM000364S13666  [mRNA]  locus=s364:25209:37138:- [translate_table: standard]
MAATSCLRLIVRLPKKKLSATFTRSLCQAAGADRDRYDVAVVGGGMVGAAFACGLATSSLTKDLRITIVDAQELSKIKVTDPELKSHAVHGKLLQNVVTLHSTPCRCGIMLVRDMCDITHQMWANLGSGVSSLPRIVTASHKQPTQARMRTYVKTINFVSASNDLLKAYWLLCCFRKLLKLSCHEQVGADGGRSKVRQMAGLKTTGWEYGQRAVISTVEVDRPHATAWQRFLPTGPLALLPLGNKFSNIVWSTTAEMAKQLQEANNAQFAEAVNNALVHDHSPLPSTSTDDLIQRLLRAASFSACGDDFQVPPRVTGSFSPRMSFPLILNHAATYVQPRLALIGDAAHTVHPLAGQGVNLGFGDASQLVKSLYKACENGGDIGEQSILAQYDFERRRANVAMMAALDGLHRVFKVQWGPFSVARNLGLAAVQFSGPLKRQFMRVAMGIFLDYNNLTGPIPLWICNMKGLINIYLSSNNLTGPIPTCLGDLPNLQFLWLRNNPLGGSIPDSLGNLAGLIELNVDYNNLTGPLPLSFAKCTQMVLLHICCQALTGPYPDEWLAFTNLTILNGAYNQLTYLSDSVGKAYPNLQKLTMGYNYLGATGSRIPSTLNYSNFYGLYYLLAPLRPDLLPLLCLLTDSLARLMVIFSPPLLPLALSLLPSVFLLHLAILVLFVLTTCLSSIPLSVHRDLSYNQYVGPIPTNLKTLPLTTIDLAGNNLTGTIPPFNPAIVNLYLNNNRFIGRLTNDWLNYTNLRDVDLSFNSISGPINVIGGTTIPPALKFLRLHNNLFTGRIPDQFGRFPSLTALYLNDNSMLGPIPDSFTNFTDMRFLRLNNNNFSGSIIPGLGKLNNHIKTLDLSYNSFTGPFPIKIVSYVLPQALSYIDISYNFFNASYPVNRIFAPGISYADFNHNCFTNATVIKGSNASATFVAGQRSLEECQEHQKGVAEPILTYPNRLGLRGLDQASETASFNYRYGSVLPPPRMDHRRAQPPTVPPIKNQLDSCDSCWAFSATAAVSSLVAIATGVLPDLSEQQLLDCTVNKAGCTGGWPASAIDYIANNSIATEDQYPYDGRNETCLLPTGAGIKQTARVAGWESVPAEDAFSLMQAVSMQPIIVAIQADQNDIQAYINGTFSGVCGEDLNHAVVVVGYDTTLAVPV